MTTGTVKYSKPACSFCRVGDEGCEFLMQVEDKNIFICDQCCQGNHSPFKDQSRKKASSVFAEEEQKVRRNNMNPTTQV